MPITPLHQVVLLLLDSVTPVERGQISLAVAVIISYASNVLTLYTINMIRKLHEVSSMQSKGDVCEKSCPSAMKPCNDTPRKFTEPAKCLPLGHRGILKPLWIEPWQTEVH